MSGTMLEGKTALVTGSSRNLGAMIACELADRGCRVVLTCHSSRPDAEALLEELTRETGAGHHLVQCDLSTTSGTERLADEALSVTGGIDILVNNAGPFAMDPFVELDEEVWDSVWDTNVKAVYILVKRLGPGMRESGWGRVLNVSAGSAYARNHSIYTLAKSALITLTEELAVELGPEITVNAVAPGQIYESAEDMAEFDPSFVERATEATPLQRLVNRQEVASLAADMCGPVFDMVTGVTIPIDGGMRLPRF